MRSARNPVVLFTLVAFTLSCGGNGWLSAQTAAIDKELRDLLEAERLNHFQWVWHFLELVGTEVDTARVREAKTLGDALDRLEEQLREQQPSIALMTGNQPKNALGVEDIWQVSVDLSGLPRTASLGRVLLDVLDQMPVSDATVVLQSRNCLYVTNLREEGRSGLLFYWALRFHRVRHVWRVGGLICAVVFVHLRRNSMGRRRWLGVMLLALRAGLVFFVWPAWLLWLGGATLIQSQSPPREHQ